MTASTLENLLIAEVLATAAKLDATRITKRLSLLHGIPIILKCAEVWIPVL